jgi:glycosyltransferase involved in cell wall biosynthesis
MVAACPFPAARGTPIRIYRIADELGRRGHDVDVVTYHLGATAEDMAFGIHRIANIKTYQRQSPGPSYQKLALLDPLLAVKLIRLVRNRQYNILHAHHVEGLLAALPAHLLFRIPLVFDAHTLLESELPYYRMGLSRGILKRIGRVMDARLPKHADHIIAVSEEIHTAFTSKSGIAPHKISIIPNGVEEDFFEVGSRPASGCSHPGPRLVYAGNLSTYQGIDLLLRAFAKARRKKPDLWLEILTDDTFHAYESMAKALGVRDSIEITNSTLEELPGHLAAADVAVTPRTECGGLPQKLLNYMAAGCPVVSFSGSAKHLLHEHTALIVTNHNVDAFADAVLRLVSDKELAGRLAANARAFVRTELSWSRTAECIETVYDRVTQTTA